MDITAQIILKRIILDWVPLAIQLGGLAFLILTPKFKGKGLLLAFFALSLIVAVGSSRVFQALEITDHPGFWEAWGSISRTLSLDAQALLLGFVVLTWMHRRSETRTVAGASLARQAEHSVPCPKCQEPNGAGRVRCHKCGRSLQPTLFAIITALGILANVGLAVAACFSEFVFVTVLMVIGSLITIGVNLAARRGRHWAWAFLQWGYGLSVVPLVFWAASDGGIAWLFTYAVAVVASLLVYYFNTKRVRAFCCVGRE
jgi:hypothetical protein